MRSTSLERFGLRLGPSTDEPRDAALAVDETLADEVLPDLQRWPLERSHQRRSGLFGEAPLIVHGLDLQLDVRAEHAQNAISMRYRYLDVRLPMELRAGIDR